MADFLRPEAREGLWRWREIIAGVAIVLAGGWWAMASFGLMAWVGGAVAALGVLLVVTGFQRLRFFHGGGGPGVVEIKERRVAYLGPITGGVVDLDEMILLELDSTASPPRWRLYTGEATTLAIPVDAEGADALFDAFSALPGIRTERMLDALNRARQDRVMIWQAEATNLRRLH